MEKPPELGLGKEHDLGLGLDDSMNAPVGEPKMPSMQQPDLNAPPTEHQAPLMNQGADKDIQILSAKIDSLKAILDNINQRLTNIERIANESQEEIRY